MGKNWRRVSYQNVERTISGGNDIVFDRIYILLLFRVFKKKMGGLFGWN
jgi:hypothetical protein